MKKGFFFVLMCLLLCSCNSTPFGSGKKKVIVLESYTQEFDWVKDYERGITETLGKNVAIEFIYFDAKRATKDELTETAKKALKKIRTEEPNAVITADDVALKAVALSMARMDIPLVFLGVNNNPHTYFSAWPKNVTGLLERPLLHPSMDMLKLLLPGVQRVGVLFDTEMSSYAIKNDIFANKDSVSIDGIAVDIRIFGTFSEWQSAVRSAEGRYDALFIGGSDSLKDSSGGIVPSDEAMAWTAAHSGVPVFGFWDFMIGPETAMGGVVISGEETGRIAADLVLQIWNGRKPSEIHPLTGGSGTLMFSKQQLKRHGIGLPASLEQKAHLVE